MVMKFENITTFLPVTFSLLDVICVYPHPHPARPLWRMKIRLKKKPSKVIVSTYLYLECSCVVCHVSLLPVSLFP